MIAEDLVAEIRPCCARIEIAGSVRRRTPGDGLLDLATGEVLPVTSERDLFARRNLPYREPWERDA